MYSNLHHLRLRPPHHRSPRKRTRSDRSRNSRGRCFRGAHESLALNPQPTVFFGDSLHLGMPGDACLEDHPRTCKRLGSAPFISHKNPIWKGSHNPTWGTYDHHGY